jgi:hypothetical protein
MLLRFQLLLPLPKLALQLLALPQEQGLVQALPQPVQELVLLRPLKDVQ